MSDTDFSDFFEELETNNNSNFDNIIGDDLFSILDSLEDFPPLVTPLDCPETMRFDGGGGGGGDGSGGGGGGGGGEGGGGIEELVSRKSRVSSLNDAVQTSSSKRKREKVVVVEEDEEDGQQKVSHITVERNRRKQMNEHLSVLRSLMPCFYVKRGDQASIIGGVVDYINELQQILQSLEAKKQRKVYNEILSPKLVSSPRLLSPRKPPLSPKLISSPRKQSLSPLLISPRNIPLSPRLNIPISPTTPQPTSPSPYKPCRQTSYLSPTKLISPSSSPCSSSSSNDSVANIKSAIVDVEVKFSGSNLVLKTKSRRIYGQAVKIISVLEELSLEILHVDISTHEETMLNSFTIKIGIECQLSAEELAQQIQQTFC